MKILEFVEKLAPTYPTLFNQTVSKPTTGDLSTLHLLLGSLSPTFDLKSMALYVQNLQLSTAKQLLKLFQVRYPSTYKAEIIKKGSAKEGSDGSSQSSEGSGSEQGEEDTLIPNSHNPFQQNRVRRSYRRIRECRQML